MGNFVAHVVHLVEPFGCGEISFQILWQSVQVIIFVLNIFEVIQDFAEIGRIIAIIIRELPLQFP
jgi:hypothetical protein